MPLLRMRSPGMATEANGTVLLKSSACSFISGVGHVTSGISFPSSLTLTASADITVKNITNFKLHNMVQVIVICTGIIS